MIVLLMLAGQTVLPQAPTRTQAPDLYVNPVLDVDFPDPDVLQVDDTYYAYATNSKGINIQAAISTDLITWEFVGEVMPTLPDWADQDFGWTWAHDVSAANDRYLMYFTAHFAIDKGGTQYIGAATSTSPIDPFEPVGDQPLICQRKLGGSIDPSSFVDMDGTHYILWKNDGNSGGGQAWIYIQQIAEDGLTLEGEPTRSSSPIKPGKGCWLRLQRCGSTTISISCFPRPTVISARIMRLVMP